jgi:amino acid permease
LHRGANHGRAAIMLKTDSQSGQSRSLFSLPRFQFSLAWLMIAVTAVAILLGVTHVFGEFVVAVLFASICCVLPTPLLICAIFARGDVQAFSIGALVPWFTMFAWMPGRSGFAIALWLLFLPALCGIIATLTRRWIQRFGGR